MKWEKFFEIQDGVNRHLEFVKLYISDVIDMFQIKVPMFQKILVTIGQIVKKWQQFLKSKMAAAAILNYDYLDFRHHRCVLNQSSNNPTKFGDDWSHGKEMATVFRYSRWRQQDESQPLYLTTMWKRHFATNLHRIW